MIKKIWTFLILALPWVILAGLFQFHFQSFLPYQELFKGRHFFDFFTVIDIYVTILLLIFLFAGSSIRHGSGKKLPPIEFIVFFVLLLAAGFVQIVFQETYHPVLTTHVEYFRSLFLYPVLVSFVLFRSSDKETLKGFVLSYLMMVATFCVLALIQFFTGVFPGESKDFMGRLTWPYVDFKTLVSSSANWVAFFVTPSVIISFVISFRRAVNKIFDHVFFFSLLVFLLSGVVLYLTQSYGAYGAVFISLVLFLFMSLNFKKFLSAFAILLLAGGIIFTLQQTSMKYQVFSGQAEDYKYDTSVQVREDIYKMSFSIFKERPFLGVGLNQYQSYFSINQERILGGDINEPHTPSHPHNFFMGFFVNLGALGFLAILILIAGIFRRCGLNPSNPALYVLIAIMVHGLIDSYYWKQEITYNFWIIIALIYLLQNKKNSCYLLDDEV